MVKDWKKGTGISNVFYRFRVGCCGGWTSEQVNIQQEIKCNIADLLLVVKLDNVMELQFLDGCISCYTRIREQNAIMQTPTQEQNYK